MRQRECEPFDAAALINVGTNSFIFFLNADGRRAARGPRGYSALHYLCVIPVDDYNFSGRAVPWEEAPPWMSSDRYSLKVNPDKLAHSLYLPGLLDRFFHVRPRVLSKASAAVIGKIVLVITITSSRFDGCSHAKLHRKQMTSFLYVYRETYLEFPLIKITERMVTRWFLYFLLQV